jgi:thiamine-phosphate pyrophosphorylase
MSALRRIPRLLAISDRRRLPGGDLLPWAAALAAAGVDALQVREKDLTDGELLALVAELRRRLPRPFALVVNGRADIAVATGADGVHLPADGLPVAAVRASFGPELLVGRSTHSPAEAAAARAAGADYVLLGPIWATPAKAGSGPPLGPQAVAAAARAGGVLGVGGVTIQRLPELAAAGAAGAAGIREFLHEEGLRTLAARAAECFER